MPSCRPLLPAAKHTHCQHSRSEQMSENALLGLSQRPEASLMVLCQASSLPEVTDGPFWTTCQIELTLQGWGPGRLTQLGSVSKAKISLVGSAFLNCLGIGRKGKGGRALLSLKLFKAHGQVQEDGPVAKPRQSRFQSASHSR